MADISPSLPLQTNLGRPMTAGALGSLALLLILVLWAHFTPIGGAVIAIGEVMVRGQAKMVQSVDGGVVDAIHVSNGDVVRAGDVLMRIDPTLLRVNLEIARGRLADALTQKARLEAEQWGHAAIDFDATITPAADYLGDLSLHLQKEGQLQVMQARAEVLAGKIEQLRERIRQFSNQSEGVEGVITSKREQLRYIEQELANAIKLSMQGLVRESQVLDLQRGQADLLGQISAQQSEMARIANSIRDTQLEILQSTRTFKEQVVTDLRDMTTKSQEAILQIVTIQKQLDQVEIRAPADGVVHEMNATTVGGVVAPGATLLQIIPLSEGLEFDLRLDPRSVDQVYVGQSGKVRFPAFSSRTTPDVVGTVGNISPTTVTDPATGQSFYRIRLQIAPEELQLLKDLALMPGMPVEVFLETSERSVLSYLLKPLTEQMDRAFRDD